MARKLKVEIFHYDCNITGETFKVTKKAKNPDELMSVKAYYEMNPEEDDRPEHIKIQIAQNEPVVLETPEDLGEN